jgi:hypothetical protein
MRLAVGVVREPSGNGLRNTTTNRKERHPVTTFAKYRKEPQRMSTDAKNCVKIRFFAAK